MSEFVMDEEDLRRHIHFKAAWGEIKEVWSIDMLRALDAGAEPNYEALLKAAKWPVPGPYLYHTSKPEYRQAIHTAGLVGHLPLGGNWGDKDPVGQPEGVYLDMSPDVVGKWAPWAVADGDQWDVWCVRTEGLLWEPDPINPGCYVIETCWPDCLTLMGTYTR